MKKQQKTFVPRNKHMSDYLIALGHKTHKSKREKKLAYEKKKKAMEDLYD